MFLSTAPPGGLLVAVGRAESLPGLAPSATVAVFGSELEVATGQGETPIRTVTKLKDLPNASMYFSLGMILAGGGRRIPQMDRRWRCSSGVGGRKEKMYKGEEAILRVWLVLGLGWGRCVLGTTLMKRDSMGF